MPIGLSQRISIDEAIRMYTIGSAYASGQEAVKGQLKPGFLADWVELDKDPFAQLPEDLAELEVVSTWVAGEEVFHQ